MLRLIKSCKPIKKTNEKTAMNYLPSELSRFVVINGF